MTDLPISIVDRFNATTGAGARTAFLLGLKESELRLFHEKSVGGKVRSRAAKPEIASVIVGKLGAEGKMDGGTPDPEPAPTAAAGEGELTVDRSESQEPPVEAGEVSVKGEGEDQAASASAAQPEQAGGDATPPSGKPVKAKGKGKAKDPGTKPAAEAKPAREKYTAEKREAELDAARSNFVAAYAACMKHDPKQRPAELTLALHAAEWQLIAARRAYDVALEGDGKPRLAREVAK